MLIIINDTPHKESDTITLQFSDTVQRKVKGFDLVLARRAIQDMIVQRIQPDVKADVLDSVLYTPMFEEQIVVKFDPEGLMFFVLPLKKDHHGSYADTRYIIPIQYEEEYND